jgi:hypothetical protein
MKSVPNKKEIHETIHSMLKESLESANRLSQSTAREERGADESTKLVNFRLKVSDYKRLKGLYGSQGLSLSAGIRMTALYMAAMVEQGAFSLSAGGYIDRRGRT